MTYSSSMCYTPRLDFDHLTSLVAEYITRSTVVTKELPKIYDKLCHEWCKVKDFVTYRTIKWKHQGNAEILNHTAFTNYLEDIKFIGKTTTVVKQMCILYLGLVVMITENAIRHNVMFGVKPPLFSSLKMYPFVLFKQVSKSKEYLYGISYDEGFVQEKLSQGYKKDEFPHIDFLFLSRIVYLQIEYALNASYHLRFK